jgi:hypothetical protein
LWQEQTIKGKLYVGGIEALELNKSSAVLRQTVQFLIGDEGEEEEEEEEREEEKGKICPSSIENKRNLFTCRTVHDTNTVAVYS